MAIVVGLAAPAHASSPNTQDAQGLLSANHSRLSASLGSDLRIVSKPVSNTLGRIRRQQMVPYQASYSGVLCAYAVRHISNLFAATNVQRPPLRNGTRSPLAPRSAFFFTRLNSAAGSSSFPPKLRLCRMTFGKHQRQPHGDGKHRT